VVRPRQESLSDTEGLPSCFSLLNESRKFWNELVADELVYVEQFFDSQHQTLPLVSKVKSYPRLWLELHILTNGPQGKNQYTAIIEFISPDRLGVLGKFGEVNVNKSRVKRKMPMLVNIPKMIELPQIGQFVGIPVIVRLKRFNQCNRASWHPAGRSFNKASAFRIGMIPTPDGKTNIFIRQLVIFDGKSKGQMVERTSQISDEISGDQRNRVNWRVNHPNFDNVLSSLQILLSGDGITLRLRKDIKFPLEQIEVFLRPLNLQMGAYQVPRHASSIGHTKT
jgi:hypothetical protein